MSKKIKIPWTHDKGYFLLGIKQGEWGVTIDDELVDLGPYSDVKKEIKAKFPIYGLAAYHTTDYLRFFCEEHHPEIDFDKEFETDKPGVFDRYNEKFGYDFEEWVQQKIYNKVKEELAKLGYTLPWES